MRGNGLDSTHHGRPPHARAVNGAAILDGRRSSSLPTPLCEPPAERSDTTKAGSLARVILLVLLPFVSGYYLSYLYRSINALISAVRKPRLAGDSANSETKAALT